MTTWIPLHCHSHYSILDATASIKGLVAKAKEYQIPALALTDHGNLYGAVEFYKECVKQNIKPILGCELYLAPQSRFDKKKEGKSRVAFHVILLCKNLEGYKNLCLLSSLAFTEGFYYYPRIDRDLLRQHSQGLICLSSCLSGSVAQAALQSEEQLEQELRWYQETFGEDFFSEVQLHEMSPSKLQTIQEEWLKQEYYQLIDRQKTVNAAVLSMSAKLGIPSVATNDIHYVNPDDWYTHEILINVQSGEVIKQKKLDVDTWNPKRKVYSSREFYFKSPQEMSLIFADHPETIQNTLKVAERCDFQLDFDTKHYPIYIPETFKARQEYTEAERYQASCDFLVQLCQDALPKKYTPAVLQKIAEKFPNQDPLTIVQERLNMEASIITSKGMSDYLLIVWDIIHWAKENQIPVGPGRGSGAGSVMLFLLGITELEPIRFDLFFERFINPERISYPDIDIDICMIGRERVIEHVREKYGKDNVAQIITFGTMKAKSAIKDVGRALGIPLPKVNTITKHVPPELNITLDKALETSPELRQLYESDPETREVIDQARLLEGSVRNTGVHAAGTIVCGEPLTNHIPVCISKDASMITTQYAMKPLESVGMLKIDFLGLKTLTSIRIAMDAIYKKTGVQLDMATLPLDDKKTFALLHRGETKGIFQMESSGMQGLAQSLQPDVFEEIIALCALYRPGPMDMIPSFTNRKHGREPIEYDHPALESILKETYGIMVYQEQVMQIAGKLANYSLGEGDVLRRAMGKKDHEQMIKERTRFCERACKNGVNPELASEIFDKMEKFASYGFNKSHAAAYGLITYTTAYLKANYPKEWLAALLTCDADDIEKVGKLIQEAQSVGIDVLPPDINESGLNFVATDQGIRFAMGAIKGIGHSLVENIIKEREAHGPFKGISDFIRRNHFKKITKKQTECLIESGCFDTFEKDRNVALHVLHTNYDLIVKEKKENAAGVMTFAFISTVNDQRPTTPPQAETLKSKKEILSKEKELLGVYLNKHPVDMIAQHTLNRLSVVRFNRFEELSHGDVIRAVFIIENVTTKISKNQKKFALLTISDRWDSYELPVWADTYQKYQHVLEENQLVYAVLSIDKKDSLQLSCHWLSILPDEITEDLIREADEIVDKTKIQKAAILAASRMNKPTKVMETQKEKKQDVPPALQLSGDVQELRHSHIFALKQIIRKHAGTREVSFIFTKQGKKLATLTPDPDYYISDNIADFKEELKQANLPIHIIG